MKSWNNLVLLSLAILLVPAMALGQFRENFKRAAQMGERKALQEAVKGEANYQEAVIFGRELLFKIIDKEEEGQAREWFDLLNESLNKVHKASVLAKMEKLYLADGGAIKTLFRSVQGERRRLVSGYRAGLKGDQEALNTALPDILALAKKCESFGELLLARDNYLWAVQLSQKKAKRNNADELRIVEAMLACYNNFGLYRDTLYKNLKKAKESLSGDGKGGPGKTRPGRVKLKYAAGSKWLRTKGTFRAWKSFDKGVCQCTAAHPILWGVNRVNGISEMTSHDRVGNIKIMSYDPPFKLMRLKASTYGIDSNCDDKVDKTFKVGGTKPTVVTFDRMVDGVKEKAAIMMWVPGGPQVLGSSTINMAPTMGPNGGAYFCMRGASCLSVKLDGLEFRFIDENLTGVCGDAPRFMGAARWKGAIGSMRCDSMVLPGVKNLVPFSDFIKVKDCYYKFKFSGSTVKYRKLDMNATPMGRIKMEFKGPKNARPRNLVVGEVSSFTGAFFDIAANPKGVEVPVGIYNIFGGLILKGSGVKSKSVGISRKSKAKEFHVREGEETIIPIGAPYKFEFHHEARGDRVRVDGTSVKIVGVSGEVYLDPWGAVPEPLVYCRTRTKGNGKKMATMKMIDDNKTLQTYVQAKRNADKGFNLFDAALTPMDTVFRKPKGSFEVMLKQNSHKYFGKVLSDWR